jgi:outer membrane protein assembly factor BamD
MLKQYPDAPPNILKEAKQKLREVQEVLATREAGVATYYMTRENWPAAIARYQTIVDTYPLYSHMDDVLIAIGDAYAAEAKTSRAMTVCVAGVRVPCITEGMKSKLEQDFDNKAAAEYRAVVVHHSAAPHVEDAKERLIAMNLPVPDATPEENAASEALEGSRAQYTMASRLELLVLHKPDTVTAAQVGEPPLDDPAATTAPMIVSELTAEYASAANPASVAPKPVLPKPAPTAAPAADTAAPVASAPLGFNDVGTGGGSGVTTEMTPAGDTGGGGSGLSVGAAVISTGGTSVPASTLPAATGEADPNFGLKTAQPADNAPLPAAQAPAEAPDQVNEAAGKQQLPADTAKAKKNGKSGDFDKSDESSSKHEPKKGVDKLNPF